MPRLYCSEHGKERESDIAANQALYRQEGECVLMVTGRLQSGHWLCDRCNAQLRKGSHACLSSAFPNWMADDLKRYDFGYERQYFGQQIDRVKAYGAEWPGGVPLLRQRSNAWED